MTEFAAALTFVWLGMVVGISFLEAPLKFRAPGITLSLGLGIGRLVFRALNLLEITAAVIVAVLVLSGSHATGLNATLIAVLAVLAVQVGIVRPPLNRRTDRFLAGETPAGSQIHYAYIALELVKVCLLIALGAQLLS